MDRRYKGLIIAGIFLLGVVVFSKVQQRGGITYATAVVPCAPEKALMSARDLGQIMLV